MIPLVISSGDPSSIGIELLIDIWRNQKTYDSPPFFVVADPDIFKKRNLLIQKNESKSSSLPIQILKEKDLNSKTFCQDVLTIFQKSLPILALKNKQIDSPGIPNIKNTAGIIESIDRSIHCLAHKKASALVTAPIAKNILYNASFPFPGHTEYLGYLAKQYYKQDYFPVMMLENSYIRAVPITIHIPLKKIFENLNSELIKKIATIVHSDMKNRFSILSPRLFFSGLNPHAGEDGKLGMEDKEIIKPAISALEREGICAKGPFPADSLFSKKMRSFYDVALCMYHDQALIPIKTLDFENSVNITLGLPFVRTSPAHGTAFNLVGKNSASPSSMLFALKKAYILAKTSS